MLTLLLVIIFISFIGVGLPDSVLGAAWPVMYREMNLPISLAGYISMTVSVGTVISSFLSAKLINKFGTGLVTAVSTLLTAIALLGFSHTRNPAFFFLLTIPLGLGAGAVDTALNAFVALHYSASQMSYLHCFYGIGVAASPFIMSFALGDSGNWRRGYLIVALIQFALTALCFISLPLWNKIQKKDKEGESAPVRTLTVGEMVRTKGVLLSCFAFFASCAVEITVGQWSASFFVNTKGLEADTAALVAMLFYVGLASGRFLSGVLMSRFGRRGLLRISLVLLPIAIFVYMLPVHPVISAIALLFIGLGVGPIYPNLMHLTPDFFGEDVAQSIMGLQQALTYVGIMLMPWLFGVLANTFSTALLPAYLMALCVIYCVILIALLKIMEAEKE